MAGCSGRNAITQGRMSHANKLGHSRPVCTSITRHGIENVTENNWGRPIPKSVGSSRSTGTTRTSSLSANGGLGTLETFVGPFAVRDGTSLTTPVRHMQCKHEQIVTFRDYCVYGIQIPVGPESGTVVNFRNYGILLVK